MKCFLFRMLFMLGTQHGSENASVAQFVSSSIAPSQSLFNYGSENLLMRKSVNEAGRTETAASMDARGLFAAG